MNQNQTTDNDDLQKAIEDIAGATKNDPVFSDPVAAPSTVPEGDTGELGEPVGPFPSSMSNAATAGSTITPNPTSFMNSETNSSPSITPTDLSGTTSPANYSTPVTPTISADLSGSTSPASSLTTEPSFSDNAAMASSTTSSPSAIGDDKVTQIKTAALRALVPIIDKLNQDPSQKFNLCRNILEELQDTSVLEPAYQTALGISDESERAEALLYLVESIDKM